MRKPYADEPVPERRHANFSRIDPGDLAGTRRTAGRTASHPVRSKLLPLKE
jgi:hypothetical protein